MKLFGYKCKCSYLATQVFCKKNCQSLKIWGGGWAWAVRFVRLLMFARSSVTITVNGKSIGGERATLLTISKETKLEQKFFR